MTTPRVILLIFAFMLPTTVSAQNGSDDGFDPSDATYLWPTNASSYLSSTFGETRSAHFHSALDIKTWGRKGYDVYATRDGILHRIAIGPRGYGKVIYLKHDDNSYSIYAHLLRFEDHIQQVADSLRFQDYSFELDQNVENFGIRIEQGERIGYSGASGIGPPHLHFELRTPGNEPFNPLLTNLTVKDNLPPRFSGLSVEPLSSDSKIEGTSRIYTKNIRRSNRDFTFGTIEVEGPVGLGVDVFDQADDVNNAYAVYELKMFVDDTLRFHSKTDQFSYLETHQMYIDRVYPLLQKTGTGYQRLYIAEGNTLPFYRPIESDGSLNLAPGTYDITIEATDFNGNISRLTGQVRAEPSSANVQTNIENKSEDQISWNPQQWSWFRNWVNIPNNQFQYLIVTPLGENPKSWLTNNGSSSQQITLSDTRDVFFSSGGNNHFIGRRVNPASVTFIPSTTDRSFARFGPDTFYENHSVGLSVQQFRRDSVSIDVIPAAQPIQQSFDLYTAVDSIQQKLPGLGMYEYNTRKDTLEFVESEMQKTYLHSQPESLGTFYLLSDTTAPVLEQPVIQKQEDGQWVIFIKATDNRSGIDHNTARGTVNGVRGIMEYEPENNRLVYYHPDFNPADENKISLSVRDKAGNETTETFTISSDD